MAKLSQNLSSDSLFHFIREVDWLLEILQHKSFQARYVYEDMPEVQYKVGIVMKCFCDIPLGIIKKHMNLYGQFGIGIKKTFAKRNYITPVIYFHENSGVLYRYISVINKHDIFENQFSLFPYFKIESRKIVDADGKSITMRYYDEREWRYIVGKAPLLNFAKMNGYEIAAKLKVENEKLAITREKYLLPFEYEDITYIFVKFEKDVDAVIEAIKKIDVTSLQQDRLIAKIVTSRQIERDF